MKVGQVIDQHVSVQIPIRITKVDKETREVEGICTQEVTDVHGEIVDHESMKAVLLDWPGNIREMHQPIAVGKALTITSDDDAKATILRSRISKGAPDTWEKVLDNTLCMYSIGGEAKRVTTKKSDGSVEKRLFMTKLFETSLVDNGACPTAKFDIVKSVDGQAIECQPEEPATGTVKGVVVEGRAGVLTLLAKLATELAKAPQAVATAKAAAAKIEAVPADVLVAKAYPEVYDINGALTAIACLESLLAQEWWEAREEAVNGETDGAQTARAQLELLRQAVNLVLAFLVSEFNEQFSEFDEADAATLGVTDVMNARIARVATQVGTFEAALPMVFGKLDGTGQLWIAKAGARHSKNDVAMIQAMHDTSLTLGAACAPGETTKSADVEKVCDGCRQAREAAAAAQPREVAAAITDPTPAVPAIVPAAAEPTSVAAAATVVEPAKVAGTASPDLTTLVKAAVAEATQALQATHTSEIAALRSQVEKLSSEPVPGGPIARATPAAIAVHKGLGQVAGEGDVDPAAVQAFAETLAKDAKTEDERLRIVQNLLKFQHQTGAGAMAVRQTTGRPRVQAAE